MEQTTTVDQKTPPFKKPYNPPTLIEYGDIAKLTQGSPSGRFPDGMPGMFMAMCL